MTKLFPKSRICVIDIYPSFEDGLKKAVDFAKQHGIRLNTADGKRIIVGFCLNAIEQCYKTQQSPFPKVCCIGSKPKNKNIENFILNYFKTVMDYLPIPYCGTIDINSPDLEDCAQNSLKQQKTQRKFKNFASKIKLKQMSKSEVL